MNLISGSLIDSDFSNSTNRHDGNYQSTNAFLATFNYDLNGNMYNIDRKNDVGNSATYEISIKDMTNQLAQTSHSGNSYSYTFDAMGQMITEKHISGSSTFEDVVDTVRWTADGKIEYVADGTWMTYPDDDPMDGDWSAPEVLMIRKHYYYDGMGNRVAIVTQDPSGMIEYYCLQDFGDFEHSVEECLVEHDHTVDTYFYEAGGKLLYKNKFAVRNTVTDYSPAMTNDVEWYVYGSASDGRVATVYPRYKVRDNDTYNDNFEDSPPSLEVAYNTEMISNTFTTNAVSASITGIETHRHLAEKSYEIKDHLGNVRATVSDIKNAEDYSDVVDDWRFLGDIQNLNNFYPYGLNVDEGTWSKSSYKFSYNGKQEEVFDKNYLDYGARTFDRKKITFIKTDDIERHFPSFSPYSYANNNPIALIDFNGYAAKWNPANLGKKDWWIYDGLNAYYNMFTTHNTYESAALHNSSLLNAREYKSIASKHAWYNWANYYVNKKGINTKWFSVSATIVSPFQAGALDVNVSLAEYIPGLNSLSLNPNTNNFLYNVANAVQKFNMNLVNEIKSNGTINGSAGGFENDLYILAQEQSIVQGVIDKLGDMKEEVMSDYNTSFGNVIGLTGTVSKVTLETINVGEYLRLAEDAVGAPLDFGNYKHRLAIGSAGLRLQYGMDTSPKAINGDVQKMTEAKPEKKD